MLAVVAFAVAAVSSFAMTRAEVIPTGPAPGQNFLEGGDCLINWTPDTTGTWKTTYVELMTGDNINMIHLTTVTSFDGTDASKSSFTWTCPKVTLHAPVYFYQFTSTGSLSPQWTGRFSISDGGAILPAPNATQPNGDAKPWGIGDLADPSTATPAPPTSPEFSGSISSSASATGSSSSASSGALSSAPSSAPSSASGSASRSGTTPAPSGSGSGSLSGSSTGSSDTSSTTTTGTGSGNGASASTAIPFGVVVVAAAFAGLAGL